MRNSPGQILILVLLIVVVSLAVGLSVASRNITNLRTSTQTEQSQRAFTAAEGGVEDVLSRLNTEIVGQIPVGGQYTDTVDVGGINADIKVGAANTYEQVVEEGTVAQIDLRGYVGTNRPVRVDWILLSDKTENDADDPPAFNMASIEASLIFDTGGVFSQQREAYSAETIPEQTGAWGGCGFASDSRFRCGHTFTIPAGQSANMLRIRPFWRKTTIRVSGDADFPVQTFDVSSTASTELGITRRVQVTRTALPQLPASFDYVLFSEGDITK